MPHSVYFKFIFHCQLASLSSTCSLVWLPLHCRAWGDGRDGKGQTRGATLALTAVYARTPGVKAPNSPAYSRGPVLLRRHTEAQRQMLGWATRCRWRRMAGVPRLAAFFLRTGCLGPAENFTARSAHRGASRPGEGAALCRTHAPGLDQHWRFHLQNRKALYSKTSTNRKPANPNPSFTSDSCNPLISLLK